MASSIPKANYSTSQATEALKDNDLASTKYPPHFVDLKKELCKDRNAMMKSWIEVLTELRKSTDEIIRCGTDVRLCQRVSFKEADQLRRSSPVSSTLTSLVEDYMARMCRESMIRGSSSSLGRSLRRQATPFHPSSITVRVEN